MISGVQSCWQMLGITHAVMFVRAVMMCRGEHGPVTPKRVEERPRLEWHRGRGRPVAEVAAGVHAVATEGAHEAAMLVEDVVMPDRGKVQEQARAAVVMVAVVGTVALEVLAAAEELVVVEDADRARDGPMRSSARSRTRRSLTRGGSAGPATPATRARAAQEK
jgi:hypothetical protein